MALVPNTGVTVGRCLRKETAYQSNCVSKVPYAILTQTILYALVLRIPCKALYARPSATWSTPIARSFTVHSVELTGK